MTIAVIKKTAGFCLPAVFAIVNSAWGQYGIVNLPDWLADAGVQVLKTTTSTQRFTQWCEGPVVAQNGDLFFSEQNTGVIWKVTPAGTLTSLIDIGSYSNGLDFNPVTGRLTVCERARITERDTVTGAVLKVITSDGSGAWTGGGSGGSNDLSFAANGDLFFTSWNYHVYFHSNDSSVNQDWNFPSSYGTCQWNGIEYIEEKNLVYVCQYGRNRVVAFNVNPATHLIDTSTLHQFGPTIYSPDGITVDSNYNVYVCNNSTLGSYPNSVVVLDSFGTVLGSIRMTQSTSSAAVNCVFGTSMFGGGPNPHTLYITGDSGAFKVQLKVAGRVRPTATAVKQAPGAFALVNAARPHASAALRLFLGAGVPASGRQFTNNYTANSVMYDLLGRNAGAAGADYSPPAAAAYILQTP
ncbi:MAG: SMP-30/gluconolactonase/LRE family protein [Chitinispirillaceae bacterium]|nr:SMP-30/gluconolactonase/LRE family protein [Chitinispirillaceae bacterium]